jgi:phosphonatase-like hydrolase
MIPENPSRKGGRVQELELIVFDLAGTTVEDHGEVASAFTEALAEHGISVAPEQLKRVRGASKRHAVLSLVPPGPTQAQVAAEAYASFRTHLKARYSAGGVRPILGAKSTFRFLRKLGVRVALNTGFDRETTALLLGALAWDNGTVDAIVCGEDVTSGRPAPYLIFRAMETTGVFDVRRVANVGDTVLDLQAGYNAGVHWNIGVLSGAHDRRMLEGAPHTHLLPSVADVQKLLV